MKLGQGSAYPIATKAGESVLAKGIIERDFIALQILNAIISKSGTEMTALKKVEQVQLALDYADLFMVEAGK